MKILKILDSRHPPGCASSKHQLHGGVAVGLDVIWASVICPCVNKQVTGGGSRGGVAVGLEWANLICLSINNRRRGKWDRILDRQAKLQSIDSANDAKPFNVQSFLFRHLRISQSQIQIGRRHKSWSYFFWQDDLLCIVYVYYWGIQSTSHIRGMTYTKRDCLEQRWRCHGDNLWRRPIIIGWIPGTFQSRSAFRQLWYLHSKINIFSLKDQLDSL